MKLPIACFKNAQDKRPRQGGLTWPELVAKLTAPHKVISVPGLASMTPGSKEWKGALDKAKLTHPLFSPVLYKEGATRGNQNVVSVSCFVADLDDVSASDLAEIRKSWEGGDGSNHPPLAWCLYSSVKHRAEAPRLRVVFPLAAPVPASEWSRVWLKLTYHLTDNRNDPATKDAARMHFLPIVPAELSEGATSDVGEGSLLDPALFDDPPNFERVADLLKRGPAIGSASGAGTGKPGEDFNEKATHGELLALLQKHGWQEHSRKGSAVYVTRPGKDTRAGVSGVIGWPGDPSPVFYCFTSSFPGLEARAYAPFGLLGTLEHGGRFDEAAKELGAKGYGEARLPPAQQESVRKTRRVPSESVKTQSLGDFQKTDAGNAEMLIWNHKKDICYVLGLGWRIWNGKYWQEGGEKILELARLTVRELLGLASDLLESAKTCDDKVERSLLVAQADALSKHALRSEAGSRLSAMVTLATSFSEITLPATSFSLKPWRVAFQNGTWANGRFREHQRQDFIEELLPVCYDLHADRSEWLAVLDRITGGDADFALTLQDVAGYFLSGASHLRLLCWAYGPTGTGKGTFSALLGTMMGDTCHALDKSLLTGDREEERLGAAARNKRLLIIDEAGKSRLKAESLKSITGGDRLTCRMLYQSKSFNVTPTWGVLALSNDPPSVNAYDDALRGRVMALPFVRALSDGEPLELTGHTRLEAARIDHQSALVAGFVVWAVEGLERLYRNQTIHRAAIVIAHTKRFWQDTDPLTDFWETLDHDQLRTGITRGDLRSKYESWCQQEGAKPFSAQKFCDAARAFGLAEEKDGKGIRGWKLYGGKGSLWSGWEDNGSYGTSKVISVKPPHERENMGDYTGNTVRSAVTAVEDEDLPDTPSGIVYEEGSL